MKEVGEDRVKWRKMIGCGAPEGNNPKEKKRKKTKCMFTTKSSANQSHA